MSWRFVVAIALVATASRHRVTLLVTFASSPHWFPTSADRLVGLAVKESA